MIRHDTKGVRPIMYCFRKRLHLGRKSHAVYSIPLCFYLGWSAYSGTISKRRVWPYYKVAVILQRMSSAFVCVWRLFIILCHTLMQVGSTPRGDWANVQSTLSYALVRRSSLRMPRNLIHAKKFSAYANVRPVRSEHAMHTLCERSARPRRGRRTLTERPQ